MGKRRTKSPLKMALGPTLSPEAYARLSERLNDDCAARLAAVFESPDEETWDAAHSIIIGRDRFTTLWQAVVCVDDRFKRVGPVHEWPSGRQIRGWDRIPDRQTLVRAIRLVTT